MEDSNTTAVMSKMALATVMGSIESAVEDVYEEYEIDISVEQFTDELCISVHDFIVNAKIPVDEKSVSIALRTCLNNMTHDYALEPKERYDDEGFFHSRYDAYSDESF